MSFGGRSAKGNGNDNGKTEEGSFAALRMTRPLGMRGRARGNCNGNCKGTQANSGLCHPPASLL